MNLLARVLKRTPIGEAIEQLNFWLIKKSRIGQIDGVVVSDNTIVRGSSESFLKATQEAMALIKKIDPRRYRRICRQIDYIVNVELVSVGTYKKQFKLCRVDFSKLSKFTPPHLIPRYACLLIHESTHGVIGARGILYEKEMRLRIERLCHKEEYRFAKSLQLGFAEEVIGPFAPENWKRAWGPPEARNAAAWKRLRESIRAEWFTKR